jgi:transposase
MHITPKLKQSILTHIQSKPPNQTYKQIVQQYGITIHRNTINKWLHIWDGTVESLRRTSGSGRPHILTQQQVQQYIQTPIRQSNRNSKPINYSNIHKRLKRQLPKSVSLRTVQRIGKRTLHAKNKKGVKRTASESE